MTVGNFGGSTIFDCLGLGYLLNAASRLEGANKYLGTLVCVSETTMAGCKGAQARPFGRLLLAGRLQPVMACEPKIASNTTNSPDGHWSAHIRAPPGMQVFFV